MPLIGRQHIYARQENLFPTTILRVLSLIALYEIVSQTSSRILMKSKNFILSILDKIIRYQITHLYKEPRCDERQAAVLPIKSIMVRVERKVVQVEESETEKACLVIKTCRMTHEKSVSRNTRAFVIRDE